MAAIGSLAGKGNNEQYGGADDGGPWTESGVCGSVHCPPMYTESGRGDWPGVSRFLVYNCDYPHYN